MLDVRISDLLRQHPSMHDLPGLVACLRDRSDLLSQRPRMRWDEPTPARMLAVLPRLAKRRCQWVRRLWDWRPPRGRRLTQFRSFVDHLLAEYPVPAFLSHGLLGWDQYAAYRHLAAGGSPRGLEWPRLTRAGVRYFMTAPADLSFREAVIWTRVRERRGTTGLARALIAADRDHVVTDADCQKTRWMDDPFWLNDVLPFLVREWPIPADEVAAVVGFVQEQRFEDADVVLGPEAGGGPLQPDLSLRGRTLHSLRHLMANWRDDLAETIAERTTNEGRRWRPSGIVGYELVERDGQRQRPRRWSIRELLTERELRVEGARMKHCVVTYVEDCVEGRSTIWSMQLERRGQPRRVLTIEVDPKRRRVVQASGHCNAGPTTVQRKVLQQWAAVRSIEVGSSV